MEAVFTSSHSVLYFTESTCIQTMELTDVWADNVSHLVPVLPHNHAEVTCSCRARWHWSDSTAATELHWRQEHSPLYDSPATAVNSSSAEKHSGSRRSAVRSAWEWLTLIAPRNKGFSPPSRTTT